MGVLADNIIGLLDLDKEDRIVLVGEKQLQEVIRTQVAEQVAAQMAVFTKMMTKQVSSSIARLKTEQTSEKKRLTIKDVCKMYNLPFNQISSRQWRDKNGFPYYKTGGQSASVSFVCREVEQWMEERNLLSPHERA